MASLTTWQQASQRAGAGRPDAQYREGWRTRDNAARQREQQFARVLQAVQQQREREKARLARAWQDVADAREAVRRMQRRQDRGQQATAFVLTLAIVAALIGWAAFFARGGQG